MNNKGQYILESYWLIAVWLNVTLVHMACIKDIEVAKIQDFQTPKSNIGNEHFKFRNERKTTAAQNTTWSLYQ